MKEAKREESMLDIGEERSDEFSGFIYVAWRGTQRRAEVSFLQYRWQYAVVALLV